MSSAPTQTRVCNSGLAHLGDSRRITAITDNNPLAKMFAQVWDEAVEEVLADHPWNVALKREALAESATYTPAGSQYERAFEKPNDCVRWLPYRSNHPDFFEGEEEGDFILSNAAAPIIRFIARVDNIAKWSVGMRACLAAKLARKLAKAITGQTGMMKAMQDVYDDELSKAKRQDGSATGERARSAEFRSNWLDARNRSWTGR